MLDFDQWLEVEKVVAEETTVEKILKDCWDYSAKKTKEDEKESIKEWYENKVEYLNMENGELEDEVDEISAKNDDLEEKLAKVKNIATDILIKISDNEISKSPYIISIIEERVKSIINDIK